jgi:hypothetical protein
VTKSEAILSLPQHSTWSQKSLLIVRAPRVDPVAYMREYIICVVTCREDNMFPGLGINPRASGDDRRYADYMYVHAACLLRGMRASESMSLLWHTHAARERDDTRWPQNETRNNVHSKTTLFITHAAPQRPLNGVWSWKLVLGLRVTHFWAFWAAENVAAIKRHLRLLFRAEIFLQVASIFLIIFLWNYRFLNKTIDTACCKKECSLIIIVVKILW